MRCSSLLTRRRSGALLAHSRPLARRAPYSSPLAAKSVLSDLVLAIGTFPRWRADA